MEIINFYDALQKDGKIVFTNKGVSMLPLLRQNKDLMIIRKSTPPYKKYDAVLFMRANGQYILHRIMKVNGKSYFIIGDNCVSGENVGEEQIIGILTGVKRNGKLIDTNSTGYKVFVRFWWAIFPLRKLAVKIRSFLGRIKRSFSGKRKDGE